MPLPLRCPEGCGTLRASGVGPSFKEDSDDFGITTRRCGLEDISKVGVCAAVEQCFCGAGVTCHLGDPQGRIGYLSAFVEQKSYGFGLASACRHFKG